MRLSRTERTRSVDATAGALRRLPAAVIAISAVAAVASVVGVFASQASASVDDPKDVGSLTLVSALDGSKTLVNGDSETFWTIKLPEGATCPGDSANDQWRLQSFLLPPDADPVDQLYGPIGPEPWDNGLRYSLWKADTEPFVHELLDRNPQPGQPGKVSALPIFNFSVLAREFPIPMGTYRLGIACSFFNQTAKWWDVQIVLEEVAGDPDRFTWRLIDAPAYEPPSKRTGWLVIGGIGAAFAVAVISIIVMQSRTRRSGDPDPQPAPEHESSHDDLDPTLISTKEPS